MTSTQSAHLAPVFFAALSLVVFLVIGLPIAVGQGLAVGEGRPEVSLAFASIILLASSVAAGAATKKLRTGQTNGIPLACYVGGATIVLVVTHALATPFAPCTTTCLLPDSLWSVFGLYAAWALLPTAMLCTSLAGAAFERPGRPSLLKPLAWDHAPDDTDIADIPERVSVVPTVVALACYTALGMLTYIATSGFTALHEFSEFNSVGVTAYTCVLLLAVGLSLGLAAKERGDRAVLAAAILASVVVAAHFPAGLGSWNPAVSFTAHLFFAAPAVWAAIAAGRNLRITRSGDAAPRGRAPRADGAE